MTKEELSVLTIDSFEDFEAGQSSNFKVEEGAYDAQCVGTTMVKTEWEGKERVVLRLLWQFSDGDNVHTIRGNDWSISSAENSKFRQEVSKWFSKTDWADICKLLVKAGVLIKNEDGSARIEPDAFIGKKAKLLIANKKSKKGGEYPVITSMSPSKIKTEIPTDEVPWFLVQGDESLYVKLMDGITVRAKKETEGGNQGLSVSQAVAGAPAPQQQPVWGAATTPTAPNPTPAQQPVPQVNDDDDLPF